MSRQHALRGVVALVCTGCVSAGAVATAAPTTASNKRAAVRDATALLAGVMPPAGAVLQSSGAGTGPHVPLLTAAFASAVAFRTWRAPGNPASVLSSVEAHLPPGSTLVSRGSGGPDPVTQSITRSWPARSGVLAVRWLEVDVTPHAGATVLHAESQSQWVVTRPSGERIPPGVHEVDVTSGLPGKPPFLSRHVIGRRKIHALVALFDSLGVVQPGATSCPGDAFSPPAVVVTFRAGPAGRRLARASVSAAANLSWPAAAPGWSCFPVDFSILGRRSTPLIGNVITPIQRLLHVRLNPPNVR